MKEMPDSPASVVMKEQSTPSVQGDIPAWCALLSGAIAGVSVDVSLFPIDTIKTRLQSAQGFWKSGGFKGIYRGLSAAATGSAPGAALFFFTYETSKSHIHHQLTPGDAPNSNPLVHMLAASCGETAACLVRVPTEVIKQRMQTGAYNALPFALSDTFKRYGIRGFYTGYFTTVAREIPFSFIQFPLWERAKIMCSTYLNDGQDIKPYQGALCGSFSGGFAAAVTTPLDVIKTRLMLRFDANNIPYKGFSDVCSRVYAEGGYNAFFAGVVPRVSWIFVGGFFFFGAYEKSKQMSTRYVAARSD